MKVIRIAIALAMCLAMASCKDDKNDETDTSVDTVGDTTGDTAGDTVADTTGDTGSEGDIEEDGTYVTTVGSEGGTVAGPDGLTLSIPVGALAEDVTFTIQTTAFTSADITSLSAYYELLPHGTEFLLPVRVTIPYDPVAAAGHEGEIAVWTHIDGTDYWYELDSAVDTVAHTVTGTTNHLSIDWAGYRTAACTSTCTPPIMPPPPPPAPGGECDGEVIMTCQQLPSGCFSLLPLLDCAASGQTCSEVTEGADCVGTCADECTIIPGGDNSQCEFDLIIECLAGPGDCNHMTATDNCAAGGLICDDDGGTGAASCVDPCPGECTPAGGTQCAGTFIETCSAGTDGCFDWASTTNCADTSGWTCDDTSGTPTCVEPTTGSCTTAGGTCYGAELPTCPESQEPASPDPVLDCLSTQFCCVTASGSGCSGLGGACFPAEDLGCITYGFIDNTDPAATCPGGRICCILPA